MLDVGSTAIDTHSRWFCVRYGDSHNGAAGRCIVRSVG